MAWSYSTEASAGGKITAVTFGGAAINGVIGFTVDGPVADTPISGDGHSYPGARPIAVGGQDVVVTVYFLDGGSVVAPATAAGTLVLTLALASGTSSTITMTTLVPRSFGSTCMEGSGKVVWHQEFRLEGSQSVVVA